MENKKKNSGLLVGIFIGIIIMLVVFIGLIGTNNISFNKKTDNDIKQEENNNLENVDKEQENSNDNNKSSDEKTFYNIEDLNIKTLDGWDAFSSLINNKNIVDSVDVYGDTGISYMAELDLTGKVRIYNYKSSNTKSEYLNVDNVTHFIKFQFAGVDSEQLLYLLDSNGDVYSYKFGESDNNNYVANKVNSVSKVKKLFISHYSKKNAGGSWALFAITKNNDCIMLKGESV